MSKKTQYEDIIDVKVDFASDELKKSLKDAECFKKKTFYDCYDELKRMHERNYLPNNAYLLTETREEFQKRIRDGQNTYLTWKEFSESCKKNVHGDIAIDPWGGLHVCINGEHCECYAEDGFIVDKGGFRWAWAEEGKPIEERWPTPEHRYLKTSGALEMHVDDVGEPFLLKSVSFSFDKRPESPDYAKITMINPDEELEIWRGDLSTPANPFVLYDLDFEVTKALRIEYPNIEGRTISVGVTYERIHVKKEIEHAKSWLEKKISDDIYNYMTRYDVVQKSGKLHSKYPNKCPNCGAPAYVGLNTVECSKHCSK